MIIYTIGGSSCFLGYEFLKDINSNHKPYHKNIYIFFNCNINRKRF